MPFGPATFIWHLIYYPCEDSLPASPCCRYNKHINNAIATMLHFLVDGVCSFVTVVFITELTKFLAGRLRPNFLQVSWSLIA